MKTIEASREAKRLAAVVLDVLAGSRTPLQAAEVLGCRCRGITSWRSAA
jgi:hypothetical protein